MLVPRSSAVLALLCAALLTAASGCRGKARRDDAAAAGGPAATATDDGGVAAGGKPSPCVGAQLEGPIAWIRDDYAKALACAVETDRPLVIDMWAPWCHTCLSMQSFVLTDPSLKELAGRFVWLTIDTDREDSARVVAKLPVTTWPTFFVVSPQDESVQGRWLGSATIEQIRELLVAGEQGHLDARAAAGGLPADSPLRKVRDADRAVLAGDLAAADKLYGEVLASAPADWTRRPDVLVAAINVKYKRDDIAGCIDLASAQLGNTGDAASATDFLYFAMECAGAKTADPARAKTLREQAATRLEGLLANPAAPLSADDRSDAMANLRGVYAALGRTAEAGALAEKQRALLDEAAARAPTPRAAMTFNWPRAEVYVYLGKPLELVPALEKSAAELPQEYDPPYRLAWVYEKAGDHAHALEWATRAVALAYGPRKARVQSLIVDIQKARGDVAAERAARQALIKIYEGLPAGQRQERAENEAKAQLAALEVVSAGAGGTVGLDAGAAATAH